MHLCYTAAVQDRCHLPGQGAASASQTSSLESSLLDALQCPICHDTFKDPVVTPYGNTFCRRCATLWLEQRSTCPTTRQPLYVQQLAPNYQIKQVLDILQNRKVPQQVGALPAAAKRTVWPRPVRRALACSRINHLFCLVGAGGSSLYDFFFYTSKCNCYMLREQAGCRQGCAQTMMQHNTVSYHGKSYHIKCHAYSRLQIDNDL